MKDVAHSKVVIGAIPFFFSGPPLVSEVVGMLKYSSFDSDNTDDAIEASLSNFVLLLFFLFDIFLFCVSAGFVRAAD